MNREIFGQQKENPKSKEIQSLFEFVEKETFDSKMTFRLKNEKGVSKENGDMAFWVKLLNQGGEALEGKFFISGSGHDKLIIFEQGMPGDSNKWMEDKFVPEIIKQGYSIFCIRHRGTKVNAEKSDMYVNCPERIEKENNDQNAVLGQMDEKSEYTVNDIANEPMIAIETLHKKFKQVYFIGHSNGVAGIAFSLPKLSKEITDKIRNFIGLAGFVSQYDNENDFFDTEGRFNSEGMKKYYEYCNQFMKLGDADKNVELQKEIFDSIYNSSIADNINVVLVNSPKDEVIPLETSNQYQKLIGRGLRIVDETQFETDFHDLKNLQPQTLLRLLNIYHPKSKHTATFRKKE